MSEKTEKRKYDLPSRINVITAWSAGVPEELVLVGSPVENIARYRRSKEKGETILRFRIEEDGKLKEIPF